MLDLAVIRIDGGTQIRAELNQDTVDAYAEAYLAGAKFPPVTVFYDGKDRWLADGFHRFFAAKKAGKTTILESITPGTKREAILFSLGANGTHGLNRTNADKRNAVEIMLKDPEWAALPQEKIAKACHVSAGFVSKLVNEASLHREEIKPATRTIERNGKTYEQNTANIGKAKPALPVVAPVQVVQAETAPAIKPEPEDDSPTAEELAANVAVQAADALMVEKLLESNAPLADALEENKRLNAEVAQLKISRNGYMNKANELVKTIKSLQRRLEKPEQVAA